jgi:hypothetical protein
MKTKIGTCGVDAGMIMVGDPCYFVGKEATIGERCKTWSQACDEIFCKDNIDMDTPMDVYGLGVAIGTTNGDGCYPVYLENKNGRRRIIVELD